MRQSQIERRCKREIGQERQQADQLQEIIPAIDQPDQDHPPEKAGDDVQRGERHRLRGAAEQAADIGLGQKAAVDHDLDDEQDSQHADLQDDLAEAGQPRRTFDAVTRAKTLALDLRFIEAATQHEQFIAADRGFGPEIAHCFRRGLLNGREALFETEGGQAFVVGVNVVEIDAVRILLVRLDSLDDLMFDIIQGLRIAGRPVLRAAFAAALGEP